MKRTASQVEGLPQPVLALACVECRRIKTACDRQFPCSRCIRLGRECEPSMHMVTPACIPCRQQRAKCDRGKPCQHCVRKDKASECVYVKKQMFLSSKSSSRAAKANHLPATTQPAPALAFAPTTIASTTSPPPSSPSSPCSHDSSDLNGSSTSIVDVGGSPHHHHYPTPTDPVLPSITIDLSYVNELAYQDSPRYEPGMFSTEVSSPTESLSPTPDALHGTLLAPLITSPALPASSQSPIWFHRIQQQHFQSSSHSALSSSTSDAEEDAIQVPPHLMPPLGNQWMQHVFDTITSLSYSKFNECTSATFVPNLSVTLSYWKTLMSLEGIHDAIDDLHARTSLRPSIIDSVVEFHKLEDIPAFANARELFVSPFPVGSYMIEFIYERFDERSQQWTEVSPTAQDASTFLKSVTRIRGRNSMCSECEHIFGYTRDEMAELMKATSCVSFVRGFSLEDMSRTIGTLLEMYLGIRNSLRSPLRIVHKSGKLVPCMMSMNVTRNSLGLISSHKVSLMELSVM